jgi:hypothetical protein
MGSPVLESTKSVFGKVFFEYMIFLLSFLAEKELVNVSWLLQTECEPIFTPWLLTRLSWISHKLWAKLKLV